MVKSKEARKDAEDEAATSSSNLSLLESGVPGTAAAEGGRFREASAAAAALRCFSSAAALSIRVVCADSAA